MGANTTPLFLACRNPTEHITDTCLNCSENYMKKLQGWYLLLVLDISWEGRNVSVTHPQTNFTEKHMDM
jgi:hypothetical protein